MDFDLEFEIVGGEEVTNETAKEILNDFVENDHDEILLLTIDEFKKSMEWN